MFHIFWHTTDSLSPDTLGPLSPDTLGPVSIDNLLSPCHLLYCMLFIPWHTTVSYPLTKYYRSRSLWHTTISFFYVIFFSKAALKGVFKMFDKDGNGKIDQHELMDVFHALGRWYIWHCALTTMSSVATIVHSLSIPLI